MEGVLLVHHGSRDPEGVAECLELTAAVAARVSAPTQAGFLEFADPPISAAIHALIAEGATTISVLPVVLWAASHAKGDIPAAVQRARLEHPEVEFRYGRPLGVHPTIIELLDQRLCGQVPPERRAHTAVLLVGRGSTDPDANSEVVRAARLLWEGRPWPLVEAAFVSLTDPRVPEGLHRLRCLGAERIAVVTMMLNTGVLERRVVEQTAAFAATHPELEVGYCGYLGPDPRIVDLVLERLEEARRGEARANCDYCQYRVPLPGFHHRVGAPQVLHHHPSDPHTHHRPPAEERP